MSSSSRSLGLTRFDETAELASAYGVRAVEFTLKGRDRTRSMIGLRIAILLCLPSSLAGPPELSRDWKETFGPGVLGVSGIRWNRSSAGDGNDLVLTLEALRVWVGFKTLD